jgi:hypothetical protein
LVIEVVESLNLQEPQEEYFAVPSKALSMWAAQVQMQPMPHLSAGTELATVYSMGSICQILPFLMINW